MLWNEKLKCDHRSVSTHQEWHWQKWWGSWDGSGHIESNREVQGGMAVRCVWERASIVHGYPCTIEALSHTHLTAMPPRSVLCQNKVQQTVANLNWPQVSSYQRFIVCQGWGNFIQMTLLSGFCQLFIVQGWEKQTKFCIKDYIVNPKLGEFHWRRHR